jgi:hypothetical protein
MSKTMFSMSITAMSVLIAAAPAPAGWQKHYGGTLDESGYYVEHTKDGGFYVVGNKLSLSTDYDFWLLKTDSLGDTLWTKRYGGQYGEFAGSGQVTMDGGYVAAGYTTSFGAGNFDIWLLKMNTSGDTLWSKTYGDVGFEAAMSVRQCADSGYVIAGYRNGYYNAQMGFVQPGDIWIIKTDARGKLLWQKTYGTSEVNEEARFIRQTSDGGYIASCIGLHDSTSGTSVRLMKLDSKGDTTWVYRTADDVGTNGVVETSDGSFVVSGGLNSDVWIAKFSNSGTLLWQKTYGAPADTSDAATSVCQTPDGGFIMTGYCGVLFGASGPTSGDLWLLKTDGAGDTLWTKRFGTEPGLDWGVSVDVASDSGYVTTGITNSQSNGGSDLWLIKEDSHEKVGIPVTHPQSSDLKVGSSIGSTVILRYFNFPNGFRASVFDASGRRVEELCSAQTQGSITWGAGERPGVYFVVAEGSKAKPAKVILVN